MKTVGKKKISETKAWFLEVNSLVNKDLARLTKIKRGHKPQKQKCNQEYYDLSYKTIQDKYYE